MARELLDRLLGIPEGAAILPAVAAEPGVHVVGGAVRDVLLGRVPVELDLVVEGDAAPVARRTARRLGGEARVHQRFGTATVIAPGVTFDLASTRRERYPRPGALPEVELGATLSEDLERRDFTLNALAVQVADGRLTAHPLALQDIETRRLRVLHAASFRDDPTRLLRLCRYAARLGLFVEEETARLVEEAVAEQALGTVTGERIGRELRRLMREPQPAALAALAEHRLGPQVLHPAFACDPDLIRRALELCPPDGRRDLVALAATLTEAPAQALSARLSELAFERRERHLVVAAATRARSLAEALSANAHDGAPWTRLAVEIPETVALAASLAPPAAAELARRWLTDVRHRTPVVTGRDLEAAGLRGRDVGRGLQAAREAVWEGTAPDLERQLVVALEAAARHR